MKILDQQKLSKNALKKVQLNPFSVAGHDKNIILIENNEIIDLPANVNSLSSYNNSLAIGLSDGQVGIKFQNSPPRTIYCHKQNVCSIDYNYDCILSGSWDHTAILYKNNTCQIFPHPNSVWVSKLISENKFMTGCADNHIRIYENNILKTDINLHIGPIRGISIDSKNIYAVDNYGKLIKMDFSGKILNNRDLDFFSYCICKNNNNIFVGGEDGWLIKLNLDLQILEKYKIKDCTSIWDLNIDKELLAVGSNGILYKIDYLNNDNIENDKVSNDNITNDCKNDNIKDNCNLIKDDSKSNKDGIYKSDGITYKMENGKIYMKSNNSWELIGDSIKTYDHSIPVTLGDKKYTLSFNDDDNVESVASEFIYENKLDLSFKGEIVDFIRKNFKKSTLYKKYDNLNYSGIRKILNNSEINLLLDDLENNILFSSILNSDKNIYQIEKILKNIPIFISLDICKYLIYKNYKLDLSFLFDLKINDKKEAKAFCFLLTNLVEFPPFNLEKLIRKVEILKDKGILTREDLYKLNENILISKNK